LYFGFTVSYRRLKDSVAAVGSSTERTIISGTLMPRYEAWENVFGRTVYINVNAAWVEGSLLFPDAQQEAFNIAGANTAGNYVYVRLAASSQVDLLPGLGLSLVALAQKSLGRNLDASEQMLLSGPSGVRAYRAIVSGDNGYMARAELRYAIPSFLEHKFSHSFGLFLDFGGVHLEHDAYTNFKGVQLQDAGGGYTARFSWLFGSLQWAHTLGTRPPSTQGDSPGRVLLQIGVSI